MRCSCCRQLQLLVGPRGWHSCCRASQLPHVGGQLDMHMPGNANCREPHTQRPRHWHTPLQVKIGTDGSVTLKGKHSEAHVVAADVEADGVGEWASSQREGQAGSCLPANG